MLVADQSRFSSLTVARKRRRRFLRRVYLTTNLIAFRVFVVRDIVVDPFSSIFRLVEGVVALVLLSGGLGVASGLNVVASITGNVKLLPL